MFFLGVTVTGNIGIVIRCGFPKLKRIRQGLGWLFWLGKLLDVFRGEMLGLTCLGLELAAVADADTLLSIHCQGLITLALTAMRAIQTDFSAANSVGFLPDVSHGDTPRIRHGYGGFMLFTYINLMFLLTLKERLVLYCGLASP